LATKELALAAGERIVSHFLFHQGFFYIKSSMTVILYSTYSPGLACEFFLFPRLNIKLKGCHFYTLEMIEAESQGKLTKFTEHNFQHAFKICRSAENGGYAWKGTTSRVKVGSRPNVRF
jgi:hypothetical protein